MIRVTAGIIGLLSFGLLLGPALAQQPAGECSKWVAAINSATAQRFDATAAEAKREATAIAALCAQGKTAEAEKSAKATMTALGIKP